MDGSVDNCAWVESDGSVPLVDKQSNGEVQRTASAGRAAAKLWSSAFPIQRSSHHYTDWGFHCHMN
nr:hypothetical protein Iba_chr04bCG14360 [Ipomoea batatas]